MSKVLQLTFDARRIWHARSPLEDDGRSLRSGYLALDRELPGGGWPISALSEILVAAAPRGELQLLLPVLSALSGKNERIAWISPPHLPYAPGLAAAGVRLSSLMLIRAPGRRDCLWTIEQVLRAGTCRALLAWLPGAAYADLRRIALAAEKSAALVFLFRPSGVSTEPSPAVLRLRYESRAGMSPGIRILKRRGVPSDALIHLPRIAPFSRFRALDRNPSPELPARIPVAWRALA